MQDLSTAEHVSQQDRDIKESMIRRKVGLWCVAGSIGLGVLIVDGPVGLIGLLLGERTSFTDASSVFVWVCVLFFYYTGYEMNKYGYCANADCPAGYVTKEEAPVRFKLWLAFYLFISIAGAAVAFRLMLCGIIPL